MVRIAIAGFGIVVLFVLIGRRERRLPTGTLDGQPDPVAYAHAVLVDTAEAHSTGGHRRHVSISGGARRVFREGTAQVGVAVTDVPDPAALPERGEEPW